MLSPMSRFTQPNIPPTDDPKLLQKSVVIAFQNLIQQLNNPFSDDVDMANHRITNVAWPALGGDAVPLDFLRKIKPKGTETAVTASKGQHYAIVFSNTGTAAGGDTSAPYIVGHHRLGTPFEIQLAATVPPASAPLVMNISVDGQNLLGAGGLSLATGVTTATASLALLHQVPLKYQSLVKPVVVSADGTAAFVTIELLVSAKG